LVSLKRAVELEPEEAHFSYVYAVALSSFGRRQEARSVVKTALKRAPNNPSLNALNTQLLTD
jgi:Flp pilus assembly protein TadD